MHECDMWKLETNNQTLSPRVPLLKSQQKKRNIQGNTKTLLGSDCEVEKVMRFLKDIEIFEEI